MDEMNERPEGEESGEDVDKDLAVESAVAILFSDEGLDKLLQAAQGNDPVLVAAKTVVATLAQVRDQFRQNGVPLADGVFFGDDGAGAELLLHVFKLFEKELGMEFGEKEYQAAMKMMGQDSAKIAQAEMQQGGAQQAPPQQHQAPPAASGRAWRRIATGTPRRSARRGYGCASAGPSPAPSPPTGGSRCRPRAGGCSALPGSPVR